LRRAANPQVSLEKYIVSFMALGHFDLKGIYFDHLAYFDDIPYRTLLPKSLEAPMNFPVSLPVFFNPVVVCQWAQRHHLTSLFPFVRLPFKDF
jgi:hypothetical protein